MKKLAINLATRGRPQLLAATIGRTMNCIVLPETVFMVSADGDDLATQAALNQLAAIYGDRLLVSIAPREDTVAAKWNRALAAVPDADLYMPMCDDRPVETSGFDALLLRAAKVWPDKIGVVFNHLDNLSFTSVQAVTRRLAELMGCIYVEHFPYWFVDHWLSDVAEMLDRVAFADVRLAYEVQPPTQEMREPAFWATFYDACFLRRHEIVEGIFNCFELQTPLWMKRALRGRFALVDQYSRRINDGVRTLRPREAPPDERYLRVKAAATAMMKNELLPELERHEQRAAAA